MTTDLEERLRKLIGEECPPPTTRPTVEELEQLLTDTTERRVSLNLDGSVTVGAPRAELIAALDEALAALASAREERDRLMKAYETARANAVSLGKPLVEQTEEARAAELEKFHSADVRGYQNYIDETLRQRDEAIIEQERLRVLLKEAGKILGPFAEMLRRIAADKPDA